MSDSGQHKQPSREALSCKKRSSDAEGSQDTAVCTAGEATCPQAYPEALHRSPGTSQVAPLAQRKLELLHLQHKQHEADKLVVEKELEMVRKELSEERAARAKQNDIFRVLQDGHARLKAVAAEQQEVCEIELKELQKEVKRLKAQNDGNVRDTAREELVERVQVEQEKREEAEAKCSGYKALYEEMAGRVGLSEKEKEAVLGEVARLKEELEREVCAKEAAAAAGEEAERERLLSLLQQEFQDSAWAHRQVADATEATKWRCLTVDKDLLTGHEDVGAQEGHFIAEEGDNDADANPSHGFVHLPPRANTPSHSPLLALCAAADAVAAADSENEKPTLTYDDGKARPRRGARQRAADAHTAYCSEVELQQYDDDVGDQALSSKICNKNKQIWLLLTAEEQESLLSSRLSSLKSVDCVKALLTRRAAALGCSVVDLCEDDDFGVGLQLKIGQVVNPRSKPITCSICRRDKSVVSQSNQYCRRCQHMYKCVQTCKNMLLDKSLRMAGREGVWQGKCNHSDTTLALCGASKSTCTAVGPSDDQPANSPKSKDTQATIACTTPPRPHPLLTVRSNVDPPSAQSVQRSNATCPRLARSPQQERPRETVKRKRKLVPPIGDKPVPPLKRPGPGPGCNQRMFIWELLEPEEQSSLVSGAEGTMETADAVRAVLQRRALQIGCTVTELDDEDGFDVGLSLPQCKATELRDKPSRCSICLRNHAYAKNSYYCRRCGMMYRAIHRHKLKIKKGVA